MIRCPHRRRALPTLCILASLFVPACSLPVRLGADLVQDGSRSRGIAYYVGGAGPLGNVGFLSVPRGMRAAGFPGYVEVVTWQGFGSAVDQVNLSRNRQKGLDLANDIRRYHRQNPDAPIYLLALSAGTGVATFALESLPDSIRIDGACFLGCSLSSRYDLTRALRRISGRLLVYYSYNDRILNDIVPYTGTVDRADASDGVAGLAGFRISRNALPETRRQYRKLLNIPYQAEFADAGWDGGHMTSVSESFIAWYVAPCLLHGTGRGLDAAWSPANADLPPPQESADDYGREP
ncbi:MAG: hypothetical protein U1A27_09705 [Phycisphaerae bacterium]